MEEPLDCLVGVFQVWGQNQDSYLKKSLHIRWDFSSSRQLESTLFNTSLGVTAAVTGKLIIWKINDHIEDFSVTDLFVSGIFGPLACSFLIASALQEPSSEYRQFWSQTWKKNCSVKNLFKNICVYRSLSNTHYFLSTVHCREHSHSYSWDLKC